MKPMRSNASKISARPNLWLRLSTALTLLAAGSSLGGCGKQEFLVTNAVSAQIAPGYYTIPPKVDVLVAQDNSGSAINANAIIQSSLQSLMKTLDAQNWDYRIAVTPLVPAGAYTGITQIAGSRQDANWEALKSQRADGLGWLAPFPGAQIQYADQIDPSRFVWNDHFTGFLNTFNTSANALEPGFATIRADLDREQNALGQSAKLVRNDALLLMLVLTTGEDTSGVNFRTAANPCPGASRDGYYCNDGSRETSYKAHLDFFKALKKNPSTGANAPQMVRMHAATLKANTNQCLSKSASFSWVGARYQAMSQDLGGKSYDICQSGQIEAMISNAASDLQVERLSFRTRFLMMNQRPESSTIEVVRIAADGTRTPIAQDATNGWTYADTPDAVTVYVIDSPIPMNLRTGWPIELHGTAKLIGNDRADVTFKPYGAKNSG